MIILVAHAVERAAGRGLRGAVDNPQLASDGDGGVLMVAGDHHGADARAAALADGVLHLGADGVDHPGKADEAELLLETFGLHILRQAAGPEALRRREHAQRLIRHGVVLREDLGALFLRHGADPPVLDEGRTAAQHFIGRALRILDEAAVRAVDGGHHLARGVERGLRRAGLQRLETALIAPLLRGEVHKRRLGRLALRAAVRERGVIAERHRRGEQRRIARVLHDGHFVLRQRAGLIRTDHLCAAERLHRRQAADDGVAAAHVRHTDREHHRHNRGQPLRNRRDGERHGDHERLEHAPQREVTHHEEVKDKDEHADAKYDPR